jgi:hypothetical protein
VKLPGLLVAFSLFGTLSLAQEADSCRDVLLYSARNYLVESEDIGVSVKVYDQYCSNDQARTDQKLDSGAEFIVKAVPIKGNLNFQNTHDRLIIWQV